MRVIDTYKQIHSLCSCGSFDMDKWGKYISCLSPAVEKLCRGDVGYYLGCRFVQFAAKAHSFDELINFDIPDVSRLWKSFLET